MLVRVVHHFGVRGIGAFTVERKGFFRWKVLSKHWNFAKANDAAIAYVRGNGTMPCSIRNRPNTVKAYYMDY